MIVRCDVVTAMRTAKKSRMNVIPWKSGALSAA